MSGWRTLSAQAPNAPKWQADGKTIVGHEQRGTPFSARSWRGERRFLKEESRGAPLFFGDLLEPTPRLNAIEASAGLTYA
jgi:hypothetical protein